jgi:hypothetical protein
VDCHAFASRRTNATILSKRQAAKTLREHPS